MNLTGPSHVNSPKIATKGTNSKFRRVPTKSNSRTLESTNRQHSNKSTFLWPNHCSSAKQFQTSQTLKKGLLNFPNPSVLKLFVSSKFTGVHLSAGESNSTISEFLAHGSAESKPAPKAQEKRCRKKKG